MVKLRVQELAQEKVYRLLSLTSGVPEEAIQTYVSQTSEDFKKIATALNWSFTEPGAAQVFEMLDPEKAKGMAVNLLSKAADISAPDMAKYADENTDFAIAEKIEDLKKIAAALNVGILELVKPNEKREAVQLKIVELAEQKQLSLKELGEKSGVYYLIICFYSTQSIEKKKLKQEPFYSNLNKISQILNCQIEDLIEKETLELPPTTLRLQEFLQATELNFDDLSLLTETTPEFLELIATNPIDMRNLPTWGDDKRLG
ncbi:MAG: helix-turn-helix transcriptional regulator [Desmonostoc geniculatum HA4340-LM1]|jgi:transcriptional regulator with XRE-family HTH domain|nr:helix-turn-helix transcriptional regulator [Desmonostoc geniculatum HA4340-LM1]